MKQLLFGLVLASALLQGCMTTRFKSISSQVPQGVHYHYLVVYSNIKDPAQRAVVEDAFATKFATIGIGAKPSYQFFSQGVSMTWDEKKKVIQSSGFDSVLSIHIVKADMKTKVPQTPTPDDSTTDSASDLAAELADVLVTNVLASMLTYNEAHFDIQAKLFDTSNFSTVWTAQTSSKDVLAHEGDFSLDRFMAAYADTLVSELHNDGVIQK